MSLKDPAATGLDGAPRHKPVKGLEHASRCANTNDRRQVGNANSLEPVTGLNRFRMHTFASTSAGGRKGDPDRHSRVHADTHTLIHTPSHTHADFPHHRW